MGVRRREYCRGAGICVLVCEKGVRRIMGTLNDRLTLILVEGLPRLGKETGVPLGFSANRLSTSEISCFLSISSSAAALAALFGKADVEAPAAELPGVIFVFVFVSVRNLLLSGLDRGAGAEICRLSDCGEGLTGSDRSSMVTSAC